MMTVPNQLSYSWWRSQTSCLIHYDGPQPAVLFMMTVPNQLSYSWWRSQTSCLIHDDGPKPAVLFMMTVPNQLSYSWWRSQTGQKISPFIVYFCNVMFVAWKTKTFLEKLHVVLHWPIKKRQNYLTFCVFWHQTKPTRGRQGEKRTKKKKKRPKCTYFTLCGNATVLNKSETLG